MDGPLLVRPFGPSSLDFELRVFVGTLNDRLQVQSEVARLFGAHGVGIPFPQMEFHVSQPSKGQPPQNGAS